MKTNWLKKEIPALIAFAIIIIASVAVARYTYFECLEIEGNLCEAAEIKDPRGKVKTSNEFLEVTSPFPYEDVISPVEVSGKSNFFEANTRIRIKDANDKVLADTFTTAEGWLGELHPFSLEVIYDQPSAKQGVVEVFEESAKDGSEIKKIAIPVLFRD